MKNNYTINKKNILISIFFLFLSIPIFAQSGCNATLIVENNTNTSSINTGYIFYPLLLTNKGNHPDSFFITAININSSCINNDQTDSSSNVNLTFVFLDKDLNPLNKALTVVPNQTINFFVKVDKPIGTNLKTWNCTRIEAQSSNCSTYKVETDLHTLVLDPSED